MPPVSLEGQDDSPTGLEGFSWVEAGALAAMPFPGTGERLERSVDFLSDEGITLLVSLTEVPADSAVLDAASIKTAHLPVKDFTAPTLGQMIEFASLVRNERDEGGMVGVHCTAGLGRSGTMSAVFFVDQGLQPDVALARIRDIRPGSVETDEQEQAIADYAAWLEERREP
jgi:atypical dual specificity phosphatase